MLSYPPLVLCRSGERTPISPLASSSDPLCAASCHRQASPTHSTAPHTGGRGLASGSAVEGRGGCSGRGGGVRGGEGGGVRGGEGRGCEGRGGGGSGGV